MISKVGNVVLLLAVAAFAVATAWWISFFHELLGEDFQVARECFYWTTDLCILKEAGAIFADIPVYDPMLLWVSGGMLLFGLSLRVYGHRA